MINKKGTISYKDINGIELNEGDFVTFTDIDGINNSGVFKYNTIGNTNCIIEELNKNKNNKLYKHKIQYCKNICIQK